jgi:hypothetical protein
MQAYQAAALSSSKLAPYQIPRSHPTTSPSISRGDDPLPRQKLVVSAIKSLLPEESGLKNKVSASTTPRVQTYSQATSTQSHSEPVFDLSQPIIIGNTVVNSSSVPPTKRKIHLPSTSAAEEGRSQLTSLISAGGSETDCKDYPDGISSSTANASSKSRFKRRKKVVSKLAVKPLDKYLQDAESESEEENVMRMLGSKIRPATTTAKDS